MTARAISPTAVVAHCVQVAELRSPRPSDHAAGDAMSARWGDQIYQASGHRRGIRGAPRACGAYDTRRFLTDAEYVKRLEEVRNRDERDLAHVDVLSGKVDAPNAPIRPGVIQQSRGGPRSSSIRPTAGSRRARRPPNRFPCSVGSCSAASPCDTYEEYGLGVRCIVHVGGTPDAMFRRRRRNLRLSRPGIVVITYKLIHDTRIIPIDPSPSGSCSRRRSGPTWAVPWPWEGRRLSSRDEPEVEHVGDPPAADRTVRATNPDTIEYGVTFIDPATWTAPVDSGPSPQSAARRCGRFETPATKRTHGMRYMLEASPARGPRVGRPADRRRDQVNGEPSR